MMWRSMAAAAWARAWSCLSPCAASGIVCVLVRPAGSAGRCGATTLARRCRPFPIIVASLGPFGQRSTEWYYPFEFTPLYCGMPAIGDDEVAGALGELQACHGTPSLI